jgi:NAD(P)-dependent dehydrogenase (short-subunit alcohol dehydrogenase family)
MHRPATAVTNNIFDLSGRIAIVTGASSGLGSRFATTLRGNGADVVIAARRADRLDALASQLGHDHCVALPVDVRNPDAVAALIDETVARFGRLDIMINNAGIASARPAEDESTESFAEVLSVNLAAVFTGCREAARVMLEQGSGSIINIASVLGTVGSWRIPDAAYCASKGGVINLTRELGAQWARRGVRVNAIAPGWFRSEMTAPMFDGQTWDRYLDRTVPAGRAGTESELDGVLLFLSSAASSYVVGQTIAVDGGWSVV